MHTKCHNSGILALAPTPCSKCMVRVQRVTHIFLLTNLLCEGIVYSYRIMLYWLQND